jgi:hypothetical protein
MGAAVPRSWPPSSSIPGARTSQAVFVGGWALQQLWMFWLVPLAGGLSAGFAYRGIFGDGTAEEELLDLTVPVAEGEISESADGTMPIRN